MASDFWAKQLGVPPSEPQRPSQPQQRPWWQDPDPYQAASPALQRQMPQAGAPSYGGESEQVVINQLKSIPAGQLSAEQMEQIAEYELRTKAIQNNRCPQCGGGNYIPAGTRIHGVTMPTEKCFECGLSARGPEPAIGGRGGGGGASSSARQIDTGGGAGSMYLKFRGVPGSYMPRGG